LSSIGADTSRRNCDRRFGAVLSPSSVARACETDGVVGCVCVDDEVVVSLS